MVTTRFTELFELDHPIMSAPMALHSGGSLAAAVSAAGGLGSFGGIHPARGPDWIEAEILRIRGATDRPFGVGFITAFLPMFGSLLDAALAGRPQVVAFSFGDPGPYVAQAKDAGATVMCQVQNLTDAQLAVDAGADILVAQGTEAGGHTGTRGLLPLLGAVLDRYPDIPVLAAGGITDGRSLAAVLAAGADGAWVGTAFLATDEAVEVHDVHKQLIVASDGDDTVWTRVYDIASGLPWPEGVGERVRRNAHVDRWTGRESELKPAPRPEGAPVENPFAKPPDPATDAVLYGQGAHAVTAVRPAAEVLRSISGDAEALLRARTSTLLG
ncbi:nitronate monooxygenase [Sporichthya brevicatena]|uniref:Nitronate monooxygenase n=1 Tax=Sporichthya brevicatena TaxID=171442 RepID=A0ABN1GMH2_9ACTN